MAVKHSNALLLFVWPLAEGLQGLKSLKQFVWWKLIWLNKSNNKTVGHELIEFLTVRKPSLSISEFKIILKLKVGTPFIDLVLSWLRCSRYDQETCVPLLRLVLKRPNSTSWILIEALSLEVRSRSIMMVLKRQHFVIFLTYKDAICP